MANNKAIFLKCTKKDNLPEVFPIAGQHGIDPATGNAFAVDDTVQVTLRQNPSWIEDGVIIATDSLSYKKHGWYTIGTKMYQITDDIGVHVTDFQNDEHEEWVRQYNEFVNGEVEQKAKVQQKSYLNKLMGDKKLKPPTIEDDGWYVDRDLWYYLVRNVGKKKNTLLVGPSGAGKTELIELVGSRTNKGVEVFDMAVSNPGKVFCGNLRAQDGNTYFQLARYANVLRDGPQGKNTGLIVVKDELSRAAPTANNIFLPVLDKRRVLYIEEAQDQKDALIQVHPNVMFWATANIGAEFIGTSTLDHALMNRFLQVGVTYPPKDKEALVLMKRCGVNKKQADAMVEVADQIRTNPDLSKDVSTRQLLEIAEMVEDGYTLIEGFTWTILQQFEGGQHDGGERQTVMSIIQSM